MDFGYFSPARLGRFVGPLLAIGCIVTGLSAQPVAAAGMQGTIITGLTVVTSSADDPACPSGYVRNLHDLNDGSGGDHVFL